MHDRQIDTLQPLYSHTLQPHTLQPHYSDTVYRMYSRSTLWKYTSMVNWLWWCESWNVLLPSMYRHQTCPLLILSPAHTVISHAYLVCGVLPVRIAFPALFARAYSVLTEKRLSTALQLIPSFQWHQDESSVLHGRCILQACHSLQCISAFVSRQYPVPNNLMLSFWWSIYKSRSACLSCFFLETNGCLWSLGYL